MGPGTKLGDLALIREESTMPNATDSTTKLTINAQIQEKLAELAELISIQEYGPDGPPKDVTFREIERAGHQAAQLAAAKFESTAIEQHQYHFEGLQPCPQCGADCEAKDFAERQLLTRLGRVELSEIEFHCNACRRSFFPSA